jgi:hypothetical protein
MPSILVLPYPNFLPDIVPVATKALRSSGKVLHSQVLLICNCYRTSSSLSSFFVHSLSHPTTPLHGNQVLQRTLGQNGYISLSSTWPFLLTALVCGGCFLLFLLLLGIIA